MSKEEIEELSAAIKMKMGHKKVFPLAIEEAREEMQEAREEMKTKKQKAREEMEEQESEENTRLQYRYLDLRKPEHAKAFYQRDKIVLQKKSIFLFWTGQGDPAVFDNF